MAKGKKTVYNLKLPSGTRRLDPEQSKLPITPKEHHLSYYAMIAIMTAGAIASWAFVTGGSIGVLVPVKFGLCAAFLAVQLPLQFTDIPVVFMRDGEQICRLSVDQSGAIEAFI